MGLKEKLKSMFVPKALMLPADDDKTRYREAMEGWEDDFTNVRYVGFGAGPEGVVLNDDLIDTSVQAPPAGPFLGLTMMEAQEVHRDVLAELKQEREYSENLRKRCEELAAWWAHTTSSWVQDVYNHGMSTRSAGMPCPIDDGTDTTMIRILGWRSRN